MAPAKELVSFLTTYKREDLYLQFRDPLIFKEGLSVVIATRDGKVTRVYNFVAYRKCQHEIESQDS